MSILKGGSRLQQPEKKVKKRGRLSKKQKGLIALALVLAVAVTGVLAWKSVFVRPVIDSGTVKKPFSWPSFSGSSSKDTEQLPQTIEEEIDYGPGSRPFKDGKRKSEDFYTVLIMGRDTGGGGNTDTMLLASYDVTNQKATVMSIPRDTMINVSWDVKKINSVYNVYGGGEKGVQAVYKEVAQLVGFEPDFRVVVEWDAVGNIVDAIGGVWFDLEYHMDYHDPTQNLVIEQTRGHRLLTGSDAMQVIRWRANDNDSPFGYRKKDGGIGDTGRMELQQRFLKAVMEQMLTIQNVSKLGKIAKVFEQNVETDLSFQNILWFAKQAFMGGLKTSDVEFLTMPWRGVSIWSRSYQVQLSYVVPQARQLLEIVNTKLSPFEKIFTLSDLDIMSVNRDGSVSSSKGYVEDRKAASAPVIPEKKQEKTDAELLDENGKRFILNEDGDPVYVDENGNPIESTANSTGGGVLVIDPATGEVLTQETPPEGTEAQPGDTAPETQDPAAPSPGIPSELIDPGTVIVTPEIVNPGEAEAPQETEPPAETEPTDPVIVLPPEPEAPEPVIEEPPAPAPQEPESTPAEIVVPEPAVDLGFAVVEQAPEE